MVLHIFSHGTECKNLFNQLIKQLTTYDDHNLLLLLDGVYLGLDLLHCKDFPKIKIYAIETDLNKRGLLKVFKSHKKIQIIDYSTFVDLILTHDKNISW